MTVKLVIKSANQTVDDFSLDCDLSWTIGFVKEQIAELYPTHPKKENQKLIYGGKLLPDHLSLKSVINPVNMTQERHIVHLVYPAPYKSTTNPSESKQQAGPSQTFPVPPTNPAFPPVNQAVFNPASFSGMPGMAVTPLNTGDAFQQYLAMQQMYTQFMTQYLSQYNGGVPPVIPYAPGLNVPPVQSPQVPLPQNAPQNNPRRQAEEEDRDYIDYLYIFSRATMLFAVLFYYSSLVRVMIVVSMFLFISIYVKFNRQQQEMQQRNNQRQRSESAQTQQQPPADIQVSGSEENASSTSTSDTTSSEATVSEQSEERSFSSMLSTTASLITAFFSSLIPADPVPVNVN